MDTPRQGADQTDAPRRDTGSAEGQPLDGPPPTSWLEMVASGLGLAFVLGLFGAIGWQFFDDVGAPPVIVIETGEVSQFAGGYRVEVRARNDGASAAARVEIDGQLTAGRDSETGRVTFDFIPGQSMRTGWLAFGADPRSGALTIRVAGFVRP